MVTFTEEILNGKLHFLCSAYCTQLIVPTSYQSQHCTLLQKNSNNNNPAGNCMFKVNNRNTRTRCEICSKLTIKTPERRLASFWCLYC